MIPEEMREKIADQAHEAWSGWMKHLFGKSIEKPDGTFTIPKPLVERWIRQISTTYQDLPENEKDSDRAEADRYLCILSTEIERHDSQIEILRLDAYVDYAPDISYVDWQNMAKSLLAHIDQQAAQNRLLEEKLAEERARAIVRFDGRTVDIPDDMMQHARQQLQAEGKIGVGDHIQVTPKMVWQVTEERITAIKTFLIEMDAVPTSVQGVDPVIHAEEVLKVMLGEAK